MVLKMLRVGHFYIMIKIVGYRIVCTIRVQIQAVDGIGVKVFNTVLRDKSARFRIVITRFEVVKLGIGIVIVATISKRIEITDMAHVGDNHTV